MSRLGELLLRDQIISPEQLQRAQEESKKSGERLGNTLVKVGAIQEDDLTQFLSKQYGVPAINLAEFDIDRDVTSLVPKEVVERHRVIPVNRAGSSLIIAIADPSNILAIDDLKFVTGYNIEVVVASEVSITQAIEKYYERQNDVDLDQVMNEIQEQVEVGASTEEDVNTVDLERAADDAPVVKLCNHILLRHPEGRLGYPRRALREELPRALPRRRRAARGDVAADQAEGRALEPPQDHGPPRHRRAPPASGRSHQAQGRREQRDGFPRLGAAHPVRREDRSPSTRQGQPAARHDQAGLRG
jgi:hypothetical protein